MANEEHVEILMQGVEVWNRWREEYRDVRADLRWTDLSKAILRGVDLSDAKLRGTILSGADLSGAIMNGAVLSEAVLSKTILSGADLSGAIMNGAVLSEAKLSGVYLRWANLTVAKLSEADLNQADLTLAKLSGADLSRAICGFTAFGNVDVSEVKGLETIRHDGPSTVGIDTLVKSKGKIPEVFLRGCGVPEEFISQLKYFFATAVIEFYSCFISYSHADKAFARRVHDTLQARGIRCWLDEKQMVPGQDIYEEVDRGIRLWDKVLLCASEHSLTSWWVDSELERLFEKERGLMKERGHKVRALIPLDLDGYLFSDQCTTAKKTEIKSRLAADFKGWDRDGGNAIFEREMERVIKALRTDEGREEPPKSKL